MDGLIAWFESQGEKKFRAKQVWEWLWVKSAKTFDEMSNLSKEVRENPDKFLKVEEITKSGAIGLAIGRNVWQAKDPLNITKKIKKAVELTKKKMPELMVDGEMQADVAVNNEILTNLFKFSDLVRPHDGKHVYTLDSL